jgi:CRP/FNR family transcriptional regulator, dissimilatory nitrate respiration regulator
MHSQRLIEGVVSNLKLFKEASPRQVCDMAKHCWIVALRRGDASANRGAPLPGVFAIAYGSIKLVLRSQDNEERVLRLVGPGETFGEATAILGRTARYDALALTESKVVVIPSAAIFALVDRDPRLARGILSSLAERSLALLDEVETATMRRGAQRLACYLDSLAASDGNGAATVTLPVSKTLVAARLGITKETLSRLLRALANRRLIEVSQREIAILDREALSEMAR